MIVFFSTKLRILSLVIYTAILVRSFAAAPERTITKEMALQAITLFRTDPTSEKGRAAGELIFDFVEKSPSGVVNVTKKAVPFLTNHKIPLPERSTLTAAFFVGNVDAQLLRGEKKGNPYAGELQVIETYRQMQKQNPKLRIAEVERFVELQRRGELKRYVNSP